MRRKSEFRLILGVLIWVGLLATLLIWARGLASATGDIPGRLATYLTTPTRWVEIQFEEPQVIRVGDPVFSFENGQPVVIGRIGQVDTRDNTSKRPTYTSVAFLEMNGQAPPLSQTDYFVFHRTPDNIGWVIETMLPETTRARIGRLIADAYQEHREEMLSVFRPLVSETLRDAANVIREDLRKAMRAREGEFAKLGERFKTEVVADKLVPLVRDEILPIVQRESEPLANQIGQELWKQVSIWRFSWRVLYDATPLPNQGLTQKEFRRFLNQKAVPIIEDHIPDIVALLQRLTAQISQNPKVEQVVRESLVQLVNDPEVQSLLAEIFKEVFVGNERLQQAIEDRWTSPDAVAALNLANARLDPTIVEIGVILFGSIDSEIAGDFSAVLRNRIMRKDNRWLVLVQDSDGPPGVSGALRVETGSGKEIFPGRLEREAASEKVND